MTALLCRPGLAVSKRQVDWLMFVVDCYSQAIVGWHASTVKTTPLVSTALRMGLWRRDRAGHPAAEGLIRRSDAGSQLTSVSFAEPLSLEGIAASIGSIGDVPPDEFEASYYPRRETTSHLVLAPAEERQKNGTVHVAEVAVQALGVMPVDPTPEFRARRPRPSSTAVAWRVCG